ncbi:hypothetical protein EON64_15825 [archaeon]|nr:MAG: hypothetical protein EON64_15825 [archaeon]
MVAAVLAGGKDKLHEFRIMEEKKFIIEVCRGLRDSEDLLRSLAPFNYRFQSTNIDMKISLDLVSFMFETVWFHFHAIVESIFQADTADMHAKFAALDILCYSLTSSIFLDLKMERMVFASLLKRFRASVEALPHVLSNSRPIPDESWYADIENVTGDTALETIAKLHHLMVHVKDTIQESLNYEVTRQVAAKFEKKAKVLENNTFFVRQGDLNKVLAVLVCVCVCMRIWVWVLVWVNGVFFSCSSRCFSRCPATARP